MFKIYHPHLPTVIFGAVTTLILQSQVTLAALSTKQISNNFFPNIYIALTAEDYLTQAEQKLEQGDYTGAIADYTKAIELNPQYAEAYYNRGYAYHNLQKYPEAIADFTKAIELNPQFAEAYYKSTPQKK